MLDFLNKGNSNGEKNVLSSSHFDAKKSDNDVVFFMMDKYLKQRRLIFIYSSKLALHCFISENKNWRLWRYRRDVVL